MIADVSDERDGDVFSGAEVAVDGLGLGGRFGMMTRFLPHAAGLVDGFEDATAP